MWDVDDCNFAMLAGTMLPPHPHLLLRPPQVFVKPLTLVQLVQGLLAAVGAGVALVMQVSWRHAAALCCPNLKCPARHPPVRLHPLASLAAALPSILPCRCSAMHLAACVMLAEPPCDLAAAAGTAATGRGGEPHHFAGRALVRHQPGGAALCLVVLHAAGGRRACCDASWLCAATCWSMVHWSICCVAL